jgi:hypothetical protein
MTGDTVITDDCHPAPRLVPERDRRASGAFTRGVSTILATTLACISISPLPSANEIKM